MPEPAEEEQTRRPLLKVFEASHVLITDEVDMVLAAAHEVELGFEGDDEVEKLIMQFTESDEAEARVAGSWMLLDYLNRGDDTTGDFFDRKKVAGSLWEQLLTDPDDYVRRSTVEIIATCVADKIVEPDWVSDLVSNAIATVKDTDVAD